MSSINEDLKRSIKRISYTDEEAQIDVYIEEILDPAYGCYIWPSALVMSEFAWYNKAEFLNKTVLEVGAGTSLPSLVLGKYSSSIQLVLSDIPSILPVVRSCLKLNKLEAAVRAIEWGTFGEKNSVDTVLAGQKVDFILGSDTFYEPSQFENLLVLVSFIIHHYNFNCKFYTTYQERSPKRSIQYLLDKWGLQSRLIPKDCFRFNESKYLENEDESSQVKVNAGTLSSVFLLEISAA